MTVLGDQPRFERIRNINGSALTVGTVSAHDLLLEYNSTAKITISSTYTTVGSNVLVNGALEIGNAENNELTFYNTPNVNYTKFKLPTGYSTNITYLLPTDPPLANGYLLSSTATGEMSWVDHTSIASGGALTLFNTANTFSVKLRAKPTLTSNADYKFPEMPAGSGLVLASDTSGNLSWVTNSSTSPSVASNDSNVVFTSTDNNNQLGCLPTAARTFTLPPSVTDYTPWVFFNNATTDGLNITFEASGGGTVDYAIPTQKIVFVPKSLTPTTTADWVVIEAESSWVSYTTVPQSLGTITNTSFQYRRNRSVMNIQGYFVTGAPDAALPYFQTPPNFNYLNTLDTTDGQIFGTAFSNNGFNYNQYSLISTPSLSTDNKLYFSPYSFGILSGPINANISFDPSKPVQLNVEVTIDGWH